MTLTRRTPEPLTEDPFAGGNTVTAVPDFNADRFVANGATSEEVIVLTEHYDFATRAERLRFTGWLDAASDQDIVGWLTTWREFTEQAEAAAALIDGNVEEVLDRVRAAADDERLDLAERTLGAEQAQDEEDVRSTLVEPLEQIIEQEREKVAQREARAAELAALTEGSVDAIVARVGTDQDIARRTLEAERELRGDDARKTLVAELDKIIAAPAPTPTGGAESDADGSGGPGTPATPVEAGDGQPGAATEASEPTG